MYIIKCCSGPQNIIWWAACGLWVVGLYPYCMFIPGKVYYFILYAVGPIWFKIFSWLQVLYFYHAFRSVFYNWKIILCIMLLETDPLTLLHCTAFSAVMFNYLYFDRVVKNGEVLNYSVFYITAVFYFIFVLTAAAITGYPGRGRLAM